MVSTLAWNAKDMGSILTLGTIFPTHPQHWCHDQDPVQATRYMVVELTLFFSNNFIHLNIILSAPKHWFSSRLDDHILICECIYIYMYIRTYVYFSVSICTCMYICVPICAYTQVNTGTYRYI